MLQDIHIFIPAYNEEKTIGKVIDEIQSYGFKNIIIVDDGSSDRTAEIARSKGAKVIRHILNRGAGAATQTALEYARNISSKHLVLMDADGQHHPEYIEKMWLDMRKNDADLIIGSRFLDRHENIPFLRRAYNWIGNGLINITCKYHYTDTQCGFRLLNRNAIHHLDLQIDNFAFCSEMIINAERKGLKIAESPVTVRYTDYSLGKGQGLAEGIRTIFSFWWKLIYGN